ncbi:MAG: hypothetical protein AAGA50_26755 [Pseudomonadota bacterium]
MSRIDAIRQVRITEQALYLGTDEEVTPDGTHIGPVATFVVLTMH